MISFRTSDIFDKVRKYKEIPRGQYIIDFGIGDEGGQGCQIYFPRVEIRYWNVAGKIQGVDNLKISEMFSDYLRSKGFAFADMPTPSPYKNIVGINKNEGIQYLKDLLNLFLATEFGTEVDQIQLILNTKRGSILFTL